MPPLTLLADAATPAASTLANPLSPTQTGCVAGGLVLYVLLQVLNGVLSRYGISVPGISSVLAWKAGVTAPPTTPAAPK